MGSRGRRRGWGVPTPNPSPKGEGLYNALLNQPPRQFRNALHAFGHRPQLFVEDNVLQLLRLLFERNLQIRFIKEARVGKSCGQHLLIARDDRRPAIMRGDIGRADKGIGQLACGIAADEIFLVHTRRQLNDFLRNAQKIRVKAAEQRHGPFGQARIFDHQPFIGNQRQARCGRRLLRAIPNDRTAFILIQDDMGRTQFCCIITRIGDGDYALVVEAMAKGDSTTDNAINFTRDNVIPQQRDNALQRAHPAQAFGRARSRAPALGLGPREGADDRWNGFGNHICRFPARLFDNGEIDAVALFQPILSQPGFAQKAVERLWWCADFWPLCFFPNSFSFNRQIIDNQ